MAGVQTQVQSYVPLALLIVFVVLNGIGMVAVSHLVGAKRRTGPKDQPYESGMPPIGSARERFDVKFYLVGVLFLIFDIETVFMLPWATVFRRLDLFGLGIMGGLIEMFVFVLILAVGYVYVIKRGALEWS
jgi:NADH-quinone oxidoreductase subunit A